ncbi:MAG: SCO family protein [Rhodocyclaceae bacterium]|nr:SCO family protein [Rhodocyclaceae bacterium]
MQLHQEMRTRALRSMVIAMALAGFGGLAAAAEQAMDHSQHQAMDHSQHQAMDHSQHQAMDHSQHQGMDHSQHQGMDHSQHQAMDHSQHQAMDHSQHQGMDHSQHQAAGDADPHAAHRAAMAKPAGAATTFDVDVPNARLQDQEGRSVAFVDDVLKDKVIIVDFVYTTCTTVCPVQSALFNALQNKLADRLGKSVELVSVSVDPRRDTPARLKQAAEKYGSGPNWHWLTGERAEVEDVLRAYGAYTPNYTEHPPLVLVGDAVNGQWTRFFGFPDMQRIVDAVETTLAARQSSTYAKAR